MKNVYIIVAATTQKFSIGFMRIYDYHSGPLTPTVGVSSPFEGKYLINIINYLIW